MEVLFDTTEELFKAIKSSQRSYNTGSCTGICIAGWFVSIVDCKSYVIHNVSTHLHCCKMQTFVLQDGLSPLHTSCLKGHLDVVNTLIDAAANINQANKVSAYITTCVCLVIKVTKFHHYIFLLVNIKLVIKPIFKSQLY